MAQKLRFLNVHLKSPTQVFINPEARDRLAAMFSKGAVLVEGPGIPENTYVVSVEHDSVGVSNPLATAATSEHA